MHDFKGGNAGKVSRKGCTTNAGILSAATRKSDANKALKGKALPRTGFQSGKGS